MARFSLAREEARRAWRELRGGKQSAARLAAAVAIGLFIGSQPIFGLHTVLVLLICVWFQLDAALAWVASNISNPFFAPFLLTVEVQVGALVLDGKLIYFEASDATPSKIGGFLGYAFVGAPAVGLALALTGGVLVYAGSRIRRSLFPDSAKKQLPPYRLPENAPPWVHAVERLSSRYAPGEETTPAQRTQFHYVRVKLLGDPVARMIADLEGEEPGVLGEVFDIGTGRGQLPLLLIELGRATRARGVDWDAAKIADAQAAAQAGEPLDATFSASDARTAAMEPADTVLLIDLLHYFTLDEQDALLRKAAEAVRPGGRLIVREADTERGWRSTATLMEERIFTLLRFNRGERVKFRPIREVVALLEGMDLSCRTQPAWGKTPFSNVLLVATRPES